MALIVSRSILIFIFVAAIANVVQAVVPWRPPTEHLPADELNPLLETWDSALANRNFNNFEKALYSMIGMIPRDKRFWKASFLRYSNPQIKDRFIDYFLALMAARSENRWLFPEESAEGYTYRISEIAESTFDSRIYEDRLMNKHGYTGRFRLIYLATVNPERTLDFLFESKTGDKSPRANGGRGGHRDHFFHQGKTGWLMSLRTAFTILSHMIAQSPQALRDEPERTITFVTEHARHFSKPMFNGAHPPTLEYYEGSDYHVRYDALDLLEFLGTAAEVPLVEEISHDAPNVNLSELRGTFGRLLSQDEQIQDKGRRIIEILKQRSPSQR